MSKPANPNELVDRYLQAVRFWLPKSRPQEDLLSELGEDLRSQIEARESELGRPLEVSEASEILKRCGRPMLVASRFSPKAYLIGPGFFPVYRSVLKMVLLWILVPVFLFIIGPINLAESGGHWATAWARTMGDLWSGAFTAAAVITLVFAILERSQVRDAVECKWDPLTLPAVQKTERKPPLLHTVAEIAFNWFGLIWLLLLPRYPELVFGPAHNFLQFGSLWHTFLLADRSARSLRAAPMCHHPRSPAMGLVSLRGSVHPNRPHHDLHPFHVERCHSPFGGPLVSIRRVA